MTAALFRGGSENAGGMLAEALALAADRWPIFPLAGKLPKIQGGRGFKDATTDPDTIREWWTRWPEANIGLAIPEDLIVIDIDPRHGGDQAWTRLLDGRPEPETLAVRTGGPDGGRHLYFWHPGGKLTGKNLMHDGIDLREGGRHYVVCPPSVHPETGAAYVWETTAEPADCPGWLAEVLRATEPAPAPERRRTIPDPFTVITDHGAAAAGLIRHVAELREGNRNNGLHWAACRAAEKGILDQIEPELTAAAQGIGLPAGEIATVFRSVRENGPTQAPQYAQEWPQRAAVTNLPRTWSEAVSGQPQTADDPPEDRDPARDLYTWEVAQEAHKIRVREDARALVAAQRATPAEPFDAGTVADILAREPEPAARIDGLAPWDGSVLIVAQRKTGKTTLILNLARSLITGCPFLDVHLVRQATGRVGVLNYEVSGAQLARWADEAGVPQDRLYAVNLRGRRNPFAHPDDLEALAGVLRAASIETLIVDPFGRAYTGQSQNDAGEVQSWLVALDQFARGAVGARDLYLTAHAGWNGERTRGSSALEDWADAIWTITRDQDEDAGDGARYLKAEGRDVDMPETRLRFDPTERRLSLAEGTRRQNRESRHLDALADHIVTYVTGHPGESTSAIERALRDGGVSFQKGDVSKAAKAATAAGRVVVVPGSRGAKRYYQPTYPDIPQPTPAGYATTYPDPSIGGGVGGRGGEGLTYPEDETRS